MKRPRTPSHMSKVMGMGGIEVLILLFTKASGIMRCWVPVSREGVGLFLNQLNFLRARILVAYVPVLSEHGGYIFKSFWELKFRVLVLGSTLLVYFQVSTSIPAFRQTFGFISVLSKTFVYPVSFLPPFSVLHGQEIFCFREVGSNSSSTWQVSFRGSLACWQKPLHLVPG